MASIQISFDSMLRRFDENQNWHDDHKRSFEKNERSLEELKDMMRTLLVMETGCSSFVRSVPIKGVLESPHTESICDSIEVGAKMGCPFEEPRDRFRPAPIDLEMDNHGANPTGATSAELRILGDSGETSSCNFGSCPRSSPMEASESSDRSLSRLEREILELPPSESKWWPSTNHEIPQAMIEEWVHSTSSSERIQEHLNNGGLPLDFTSEIATLAPSNLGLELNLEANSEEHDRGEDSKDQEINGKFAKLDEALEEKPSKPLTIISYSSLDIVAFEATYEEMGKLVVNHVKPIDIGLSDAPKSSFEIFGLVRAHKVFDRMSKRKTEATSIPFSSTVVYVGIKIGLADSCLIVVDNMVLVFDPGGVVNHVGYV